MSELEKYFTQFKNQIIGDELEFESPYGVQKMLYADWIASGRLYRPIEETFINKVGPYVANTHTETSESGTLMTRAYHYAHKIIKEHVNAGKNDVIITTGFGMTAAIVKFQRIVGLKVNCRNERECPEYSDRPIVFVTHMEHHSNHTSWYENDCRCSADPSGQRYIS